MVTGCGTRLKQSEIRDHTVPGHCDIEVLRTRNRGALCFGSVVDVKNKQNITRCHRCPSRNLRGRFSFIGFIKAELTRIFEKMCIMKIDALVFSLGIYAVDFSQYGL